MAEKGRIIMRSSEIVLLVTLVLCGGCSSDTAGPAPEALAGTWVATSAEFVRVASPAMAVDVIPLGGSLVLTLAANGTFTVDFAMPGDPVWSRGGSWEGSFDVLTLRYTSGGSGINEFDMTLSGNTLTLRGADVDFAFVGDHVEPAKLNLVLVRE
jgi:hypothetical protein